jgi:hypothetical protein
MPLRFASEWARLDCAEVARGYNAACAGIELCPPHEGRAYWHGFRNGRVSMGEYTTEDQRCFVHQRHVMRLHGPDLTWPWGDTPSNTLH